MTSAFDHARMKRQPFVRWPSTLPASIGHVLAVSNVPANNTTPAETYWTEQTGGGGGGGGTYQGEQNLMTEMPAGANDTEGNWVIVSVDATAAHPTWVLANTPPFPVYRFSLAIWNGTAWDLFPSLFDLNADVGTY